MTIKKRKPQCHTDTTWGYSDAGAAAHTIRTSLRDSPCHSTFSTTKLWPKSNGQTELPCFNKRTESH